VRLAAPAIAALLFSCLLLAGCGPGRLARAPSAPTDLSGHWILDPAASDDATAVIAAALPKPRRQDTRPLSDPATVAANDPAGGGGGGGRRGGQGGGRRGGSGGQSAAGGAASASQLAPPLSRRGAADLLRAFALPAARLDIATTPAQITIVAGERRRSFEPGAEDPVAVTDRFGSRNVSSGWQNTEFQVRSADHSRLSVIEHYRPSGSEALDSVVELSAQGVKNIKVHAVYRRASASEAAAPAGEGPPAPAPR
jgi:hypothetical protein